TGGARPAGGFGRPGGSPEGAGTFTGGRGAPGSGGFGGRPGGPGGAPGGLRGGPAGRGRPPQRRSRRRRRNMEELEPIQVTAYVPSNAPVPDLEVIVERGCTPQQLGPKLNRSAGDVVRFLLLQGEMVTATQALTDDMIELFAAEIGASVRLVDPGEEQEAALRARYFGDESAAEDDGELRPRPPVITVMGHVDHGKTLLLDKIRRSNVIAGEAGGITQHIGAYQVDWAGHTLTFIDTPGHEAFTAMRARGASVTDIVVLVVAADDGVMPQTIEAINHAKAAQVPILVAINKIDRDDADPNRVMQQLSEHGLVPESWGGDTITVEISALQSVGVEELLEQIVVLAEVLELTANPEAPAIGVVLEANLDVGRGPVASAIVQRGTLRVGDTIVAGPSWGRVKALINDHGDQVKEAPPSMPVQVLGLSEPPIAGDELRVTEDLSVARAVGGARERRMRFSSFAQASAGSTTVPGAKLEDLFEQISRGETATLNVVLRADVQGSLEAVTESLRKLERDEVRVAFVQRAVGGITESDVDLAAASSATVIGFNVRPDRRARELAEQRGVEIRTYEIIYKLIEDIQAAMVGMLRPEIEEVVTGDAEVRAVFRVPRAGAVAGCYVLNGSIVRGSKVRFLREGSVIWKGAISSLRRFKDDVREVQSGFECGIGLTDFQDLKEGDVIETYEEREIPRV
ncbi:MAG: translation initiation factor IF-2, partial [Acidimicrobiales bacterium]